MGVQRYLNESGRRWAKRDTEGAIESRPQAKKTQVSVVRKYLH